MVIARLFGRLYRFGVRITDEQKTLIALNDPLLRPFLLAEDEALRREELEQLTAVRARRTIDGVLSRYGGAREKLSAEDTEDLRAAIILRLIHKLHAAHISADDAIRRFDDYVARLSFNAVHDFRRLRYPERNRLKRKLRFILSHRKQFAIWDSPAGPVAGLAAWRDSTDVSQQDDIMIERSDGGPLDTDRVTDALQSLFITAGKPVMFETVTDVLCRLWGVREATTSPILGLLRDPSPPQDVEYEMRETLRILWEEIRALPPLQRAALLLNMRDALGLNAVVLLPLTGIAKFQEIAQAVGLESAELLRLWNQLPLPDETIASILTKTRQQVINLRKSARERLRRRLSTRSRPR